MNIEKWLVGVWHGLKLGSIPNCCLCFGMNPKIYGVHLKLIPKRGVVQFCLNFAFFVNIVNIVKRAPITLEWPFVKIFQMC